MQHNIYLLVAYCLFEPCQKMSALLVWVVWDGWAPNVYINVAAALVVVYAAAKEIMEL
jgi:hypothetical protein